MFKHVCFAFVFFGMLRSTSEMLFDCDVEEPSTRVLQLLSTTTNRTELRVLQDGRQLTPLLKTYIIVHGWHEWPTKRTNLALARALAAAGNFNVLLMDYSKWARLFYHCAGPMVEVAGNSLAEFVIAAHRSNHLRLEQLHLIGFSLGTHVAGLAGRLIFARLNATVHRITALDPAGPLFTLPFAYYADLTLKKSDAQLVDVLHTTSLVGTDAPLGTVDFFADTPFESGIQPGCMNELESLSCSHFIARKYYVESITSCGIKGERSELSTKSNSSCLLTFGYYMPEDAEGVYTFEPRESAPYGKYSSKCVGRKNDRNGN